MAEYYTEYPFLSLFAAVYLFLVLVKVIVCLSHLPTAATAMQQAHPGLSLWAAYFSMIVGVLFVIPFIILPTLKAEGWRFFFTYSEEQVTRDVLSAIDE